MFSLIITIISIALVAALALAALHYGGEAFSAGAAAANAAKIIAQGEQLLGASELYLVQTGQWPLSTQHLIDEGYLKSIPLAQGELISTAQAVQLGWVMPVPGQPTFVLAQVTEDVCRNVNKRTTKSNGILLQAYAMYSAQCFGESLTALKVVVTKGGHTLAAAAAVDSVELPRAWLSEDTTVPDVEALGRWAALPDSPPAATSQTSQISGPAEGAPIEISTGFMRVQMVYNEETPDYGFMYNAQIQRTYSSNIFIVRNTGPTFTVNFAPPTVSSNFMGANISTNCGALGPNEECSIQLSGFARVEDHSYTATITLGMDMTIPGQTLAEPRLTTQFFAISD